MAFQPLEESGTQWPVDRPEHGPISMGAQPIDLLGQLEIIAGAVAQSDPSTQPEPGDTKLLPGQHGLIPDQPAQLLLDYRDKAGGQSVHRPSAVEHGLVISPAVGPHRTPRNENSLRLKV